MKNVLCILAILAALYVAMLPWRDFWYPDEPDMAEITRQMVLRGDWLELYFGDRPFPDYPPLYFWFTSSLARIGGFSETVLRLPTTLSALALILAAGLWTHNRLGPRPAFYSTLVLGTMVMFIYQSVNMHLDMTFAALIGISIFLFDIASQSPARGRRIAIYAASTLAMGLASLTKGPAGFILPLAVLAAHHLIHRRWQVWRSLLPVAVGAAIVFCTWAFAYAAHSGQSNLLYFIYSQNIQRFTTTNSHHQPWYYYALHIWPNLLPWSPLLPAGIASAVLRKESGRKAAQPLSLALVWLIVMFLFFSTAQSKRVVYLLPTYPAAAILIGFFINRALNADRPWMLIWLRAGLWLPLLVLAAIGAAVPPAYFWIVARHDSPFKDLWPPLVCLSVVMLAGAIIAALSLRNGRRVAAIIALAGTTAATALLSNTWLAALVDDPLSAKTDALWLASQLGDARTLGFIHETTVIPNEASALCFYGQLSLRLLETEDDMHSYLRDEPSGLAVVLERDLDDLIRENPSWRVDEERRLLIGDDTLVAVRIQPRPGADE